LKPSSLLEEFSTFAFFSLRHFIDFPLGESRKRLYYRFTVEKSGAKWSALEPLDQLSKQVYRSFYSPAQKSEPLKLGNQLS
jgi:hypothetical protein